MVWHVLTGFDPALLLGFILAGLVLNITPGADFLFVSASGIRGGPHVGMAAALGIGLGIALHVLAAAAGVSAMLLAHPGAYDLVRYLGAAYLAWLAVQTWRAAACPGNGHPASGLRAAVRRGFLTNALNPKTALFIFAFIPQFTDPELGPIWLQILILGAIFLLNGLLVVLLLGAAAGAFAQRLRARAGAMNRVSAIIFGGLAARLAFG